MFLVVVIEIKNYPKIHLFTDTVRSQSLGYGSKCSRGARKVEADAKIITIGEFVFAIGGAAKMVMIIFYQIWGEGRSKGLV